MHHRRSRTNRRESNRLDSKAFRQAEKRALDRPPSVPPSDCWGRGAELPIPDDTPSNGKSHGKKKVRKPKEKCPVNRVYEWYKEEIPNPDRYSYFHEKWFPDEGTYTLWTCIHCWKEHKPGRKFRGWRRRFGSSASYRTAKLVLPKRPVKF